jgi:predicted NBD/HSP70 family sugar kinase
MARKAGRIKATREGLKTHNRRLILRCVYSGEATNRAALAGLTGLAKPTVSDIVGILIDEGLLVEEGFGESTESGGKRPIILRFEPTVRQIVGVSVDGVRVEGVLANLDGGIVVRHYAPMNNARGEAALNIVMQAINALVAQLEAPLLCIVVGTPGIVSSDADKVIVSRPLGWQDYPLAERLKKMYNAPAYVGNNTELAARAATRTLMTAPIPTLVTILINAGIEIGIAVHGAVFHHSGDLGFLHASGQTDQPLVAFLGRDAIFERLSERVESNPESQHLIENFSYLHLQYGYHLGDSVALAVYDELSHYLAQVFAWIVGLVRPDEVVLAGDIVDLGAPLLTLTTQKAADLLPPELLKVVSFSFSKDPTLSVSGTIAFAQHEALGVI